ncbi:MAG: primosomal protein N' [Candidatus Cloacimonetes bacterium]|nr:primosomal protein N' [Candidatus Cloacimonadota bacterium]
MPLYEVSVPLKLNKSLGYQHHHPLPPGIRVIVSVGRSLYTGIVIQQIEPEAGIRYKNILEVVDDTPVMPTNMLQLAMWMSDYYKTALGVIIDTMLPLALKHQVTQKVRLLHTPLAETLTKTEHEIINALQKAEKAEWVQVITLREIVRASDFYHAIESLEKEKAIEVFRSFDEKIKPVFANYVRALPVDEQNIKHLQKLTENQQSAYDIIHDAQGEIALKDLAPKIPYATVKALKTKKLIEVTPRKVDIDIFEFVERQPPKKVEYHEQQCNAINTIKNALDQQVYSAFLLYGITGSGKTEVYIEAIKHSIDKGKTAIMLVPEISLTPQTVGRFYNVFGDDIAVLHSSLNDRERYFQWKLITEGKIKIVIGARSAIFAPLKDIGVIIVDEEHESSYKQDHQPCYNGRDIAVMRAGIEKAVVILGSATPSLESWGNSLNRKYKLLTMDTRPGTAILPNVSIVDMKNEEQESFFSTALKQKILDRLEKKEQVILFHNRRGYSNYIQCGNCGKVFRCDSCDISLTYHKNDSKMICHYCGYFADVPRKCPECNDYRFNYGSPGTEQIESQLKLLFPSAKILRMDSDTTRQKNSFNEMFEAMRNQHIDILLGTQMISKGLDFHNVTLVGVILAETTLNMPDFRAVEKTFQLLTQVAGRSGRGDKKGEVIIQTRNPEHYALTLAAKQDFLGFSYKEIVTRSELFYPPKYKLCRILFACLDLEFLKEKLINSQILLKMIEQEFPEDEFILLPFIEAPLPKIKNKYRYHLIIKAAKGAYVQRFLDRFIAEFDCPQKIDMTIDIDPLSLM